MGRALLLLIAGALGGLLAWMVSEPFAPHTFASPNWSTFETVLAAAAGAFIGGFIGAASGWAQGSRKHLLFGLGGGVLVGLFVGPFAIALGSMVYNAIGNVGGGALGTGSLMEPIARSIGWAIFGALVGLGEGAVGRSTRRAFQGLIGGLLGGAIGGFLFSMVGHMMAAQTIALQGGGDEVGTIPRAIGLTCTGAGIGLMIGIVEAIARQAWVRLILGRNEGKEWSIDAPQTMIGRDERAHVPLFGDPNVAPLHAIIVKQGSQYWLQDAGAPIGIGLNGARVQQQAPLKSGDMIQVSGMQLQFVLRGDRVHRAGPESLRQAPMPMQQMPMQQVPAQPAPMQHMPTQMAMPAQSAPVALDPTQAVSNLRRLVATSGPLTGQAFPLVSPIEIGREGSAIPVSFDTLVSRRHASLSPDPQGVLVQDLGSTNGTMVNGTRVTQAYARIGETIQIGSTIFRVE